MKKEVHPKYYDNINIKCACGATFKVGSTLPELNVEICSKCHPFYTGKQKLLDTAGRVDKFKARAAQQSGISALRKGKKAKKARTQTKKTEKASSKKDKK